MKRYVSLEEISDGKLYEINDLVKADCNDCKGCSACCEGMGQSIILNPYDIYVLSENIGMTFQEMLAGTIELNVVDGVILPNLKMETVTDKCVFLKDGRCSIHNFRPSMCRLFPLGRYYENEGFKYFLQIHECKNSKRSKIKVKKWIDIVDVNRHETFVNDWHYFLKDMEKLAEGEDAEMSKNVSMAILNNFFIKGFSGDFYNEFYKRLEKIREMLSVN